ncbi:MAG: hypothetical protein LBU15_01645 [Rickettsiales bacterium]|nr:hypothetical protein [Rickettsiales bacterium]
MYRSTAWGKIHPTLADDRQYSLGGFEIKLRMGKSQVCRGPQHLRQNPELGIGTGLGTDLT